MNKHRFSYIDLISAIACLLVITGTPLKAQFLSVEMEVMPEISVDVQQNLDFGTLVPGQGVYRLNKNDPNIGIFRIKGLSHQELFLNFDAPETLQNSESGSNGTIPISLEFAYSKGKRAGNINAQPLNETSSRLVLGNDENITIGETTDWQYAYIYVFGNIMVGDVSPGIYEAELRLTVEY